LGLHVRTKGWLILAAVRLGIYLVVAAFRFTFSVLSGGALQDLQSLTTLDDSELLSHSYITTCHSSTTHNRKDGQSRTICVYSHAYAVDACVAYLHRYCYDRSNVD
jgi:hypothetical protein